MQKQNAVGVEINKTLLKKLGFEDYRDFAIALGNWAYTKYFTYNSHIYEKSFKGLVKEFVKEAVCNE